MRRYSRRSVKCGIAAGAAALTTMGGVAWAAVPSTDGTIKGCYARTSGLLGLSYSKGDVRIVDSGERCRSYETEITWSQRGPKGEPGPVGPAGPAGPAGPPGPSGPTATTVVRTSRYIEAPFSIPSGESVSAAATCPDGKALLGGGGSATLDLATLGSSYDPRVNLVETAPSQTMPNTWVATAVTLEEIMTHNSFPPLVVAVTASAVCTA